MSDEPKPSGATQVERALAKQRHYEGVSDNLRQRSDLAAKVIASVGTTLLTAVGIARFSDIWPYPPGARMALWAVSGGFLLMAVAFLGIAYRYWKVTRPLMLRANLRRTREEVSKREMKRFIVPIYGDMAALNDVESLEAYQARAHRLQRVLKWLPTAARARIREEADLILAEVDAVVTRARATVVRFRVVKAGTGPLAILLYAMFVAGLVFFGLGADWIASERTDRVLVAKACADARAVGTLVEAELPPICGTAGADEVPGGSTDQAILKAHEQLAAALTQCRALVEADPALGAAACDPIEFAMDALVP